ncbi:MAG: transporter [Rubrivivax sp.]|nr:transporter [Rubrivivax sp.]
MTARTPLPNAPTYGSDEHGLICGFRFVPGLGAEPIERLGTDARPGGSEATPGFMWLHLNLSHAGAENWLRAHGGLPDEFFEALQDVSRSTRIERLDDALFAVINDVTFDFTFDASDVATLWLYVQADRVVSARARPLRAVDRLRTAIRRGDTLGSSIELLDHLLRDQADELQRIVRRAADRLDDIEDEVLAGHHVRHTIELARLRRLMVRLRRLLAPEPSALQRTLAKPPKWVPDDGLQDLMRASEEFALVLRDVGALQERIKLMQDEAATRVQEENSRSLYMLTMVTVLALPINLVAGLMGMNVGGVPFGEQPHGFWWMVALIGALTGLVAWRVVKRLRPRRL